MSELDRLRRRRKWLIITGVPLAAVSLVLAILFGGPLAVLAAMGACVAMKTANLITKHEPLLDD